MRYFKLLSILLVMLVWALPAATQESALSPAQEFAASSCVRSDKCAVIVIDLKTKKVVDSHNADTPLVPASVNKAVTIASLLSKSGLDYRYHTKVYLGGKVDDGVLEGDLIIKGGGDPTLGTDEAPKGADFTGDIVKALKKKKIETIQGKIIVDSSVFPGPATPPSWQAGDLPHSYGTGCHGFNWQHNASGKSAVKDPASKFVAHLTSALARQGIRVQGETLESEPKGKAIVDYISEPVSEIMRYCMKESDNLYAETFLRTLAMLGGKEATPERGAEIELKFWDKKGSPTAGVRMVDGSGLSRSNRLTARFLADVLVRMAGNADYASFFPLAGVEGTLKRFLKGTNLEDYIAMKTGTMRGIQCYAGYMLDDDYAPTHVVVVLVNDFKGSRQSVKDAVQRMLTDTFFPSK